MSALKAILAMTLPAVALFVGITIYDWKRKK